MRICIVPECGAKVTNLNPKAVRCNTCAEKLREASDSSVQQRVHENRMIESKDWEGVWGGYGRMRKRHTHD